MGKLSESLAKVFSNPNPDHAVLLKIFENFPLPVLVKNYSQDQEGTISFANQSYLDYLRKELHEVVGKNQRELHSHRDFTDSLIQTDQMLIKENLGPSEAYESFLIDGEVHHMRAWKIVISENEVISIGLDERETLDIEKQLEIEKSRSLEAARLSSLSDMAGGIAHEINNPLSIIKMCIQGIRKNIENKKANLSDSQVRDQINGYLEKTDKTIDRVVQIIRGLRTFAREGTDDPFEEILLEDLLEETMEFTKLRLNSLGIKLVFDIPQGFTIHARGVLLSQVLLNLLNNSIDALTDQDRKWIKIGAVEAKGRKIIRVTDSGEGIAPKLRKKVFNPFFTTKEPQKGTGLGLSISKGIVEDMGGRFYYDDSSTNTSFVISLAHHEGIKKASSE